MRQMDAILVRPGGNTLNYSLVGQEVHLGPILPWEVSFQELQARRWMADNWRLSLLFCLLYGFSIIVLKGLMSGSPALGLRKQLVAWNTAMALFSIVGTIRTWPELLQVYNDLGLRGSVCQLTSDPVSASWSYLFVLSKVVELGDTAFVILRKQKLHFLHWYHHMTVLMYCWYSYKEHAALGRWFTSVNFAVHAMMYTYFALRALKIKVPRLVAMMVTTSQIVQMILGASLSVYSYWAIREGPSSACAMSRNLANLSLLLYASYLYLFLKFFYASYLKPKTGNKDD